MEENLKKLRIVIDTNIFVSFLKRGFYRRILDFWIDGKFELLTSNEILDELLEVLARPKFSFSKVEIIEMSKLISEKAIIVEPKYKLDICSDADDNIFLECASEGKADYIVTGDPHLKDIGKYKKTKIISASVFINEVMK